MANNIKSRIYKARTPALKFCKKVNGTCVKHIITDIKIHDKYRKEIENIYYVVYYGKYVPIRGL